MEEILQQPLSPRQVSLLGGAMVYKLTLIIAFVAAEALGHAAQAQTTKVPRIGYLTLASASSNLPRREAFLNGLRTLGYIEGKT
jgi:hypothetical protein